MTFCKSLEITVRIYVKLEPRFKNKNWSTYRQIVVWNYICPTFGPFYLEGRKQFVKCTRLVFTVNEC